jgi:hypothetical protein
MSVITELFWEELIISIGVKELIVWTAGYLPWEQAPNGFSLFLFTGICVT